MKKVKDMTKREKLHMMVDMIDDPYLTEKEIRKGPTDDGGACCIYKPSSFFLMLCFRYSLYHPVSGSGSGLHRLHACLL